MGGLAALVIAGLTGDVEARDFMVKTALVGAVAQLVIVLAYAIVINGSAATYSADIAFYFDPTLPDVPMVDRAAVVGSLLAGSNAVMFWLGAIIVGIIAPAAILARRRKASSWPSTPAVQACAASSAASSGACSCTRQRCTSSPCSKRRRAQGRFWSAGLAGE